MATDSQSSPIASGSSDDSNFAQELEHINQEMYKKNLELNIRNKTLSLLRKIDEIILSSVTDTKQIAQQVADVVVVDAEFKAIAIFLLNAKDKKLVPLAVSHTENIAQAEAEFQRVFFGDEQSLDNTQNLVIKSVNEKTMQVTHDLYDVLIPHFNEGEAKKMQELLTIASILVYPLVVRDEIIGAMVVSLGQAEVTLTQFQRDLVSRLAGVIGIAIDNALLYQEIQEANEKLKALDKLKDEFISLAAHELRTPMTAVKSYLWMILNRAATLDDTKKKLYMERVYNSTERLIYLVNDMLNVSRIESGRLTLTPANMSIVILTHEVVEEFAAKVTERKQSLVVVDSLIPEVFADKDKMHEVLLNLIGNAIKYTPEGGKITVSFKQNKASLSPGGDNGMIETAVSDTGKGISKEGIAKLFTKFGRLDNTLVAVGETGGSGLGLYICKQLVELSGGKIWVESEVGRGSTFAFTLPTHPPVNVHPNGEAQAQNGQVQQQTAPSAPSHA